MKITRRNKEYGYTIEYSCSECGVVVVPEFFIHYGDNISIDISDLVHCSCGAELRRSYDFEVVE